MFVTICAWAIITFYIAAFACCVVGKVDIDPWKLLICIPVVMVSGRVLGWW